MPGRDSSSAADARSTSSEVGGGARAADGGGQTVGAGGETDGVESLLRFALGRPPFRRPPPSARAPLLTESTTRI
jgi:hypothetical protein